MSWLRMFVQCDIDDWKRALANNKAKMERQKKCEICGTGDPLSYPRGITKGARCPMHNHFSKEAGIKGAIKEKVGNVDTSDHENPSNCEESSAKVGIRKCPLCHQNENTIRHIIDECPVVHACCKIVKAPPINHAFNPKCKALDFARVICMLHQVRLILYRKKALGIIAPRDIDYKSPPAQNLEEILRAYARYANPAIMSCVTLGRALKNTGQEKIQVNHGLLMIKAPSEYGFVQSGKPILAAEKEFEPGEKLFSARTEKEHIPQLDGVSPPLPSPLQGEKGNAQWKYAEENGIMYINNDI